MPLRPEGPGRPSALTEIYGHICKGLPVATYRRHAPPDRPDSGLPLWRRIPKSRGQRGPALVPVFLLSGRGDRHHQRPLIAGRGNAGLVSAQHRTAGRHAGGALEKCAHAARYGEQLLAARGATARAAEKQGRN